MPPLEGAEFCEAHLPVPFDHEPLELPFAYRLARRMAAVALLGLLLFQFYLFFRLVYSP